MRQVWIARAGLPEVLEVREAPDPEPGPGEVRVKVAYSGVNYADIVARMGQYPDAPPIPCVVGYEVAGTVDALGEGAGAPAIGSRVLAFTKFNGYSERVVVPAAWVLPLPDALPLEQGAAIPVNYLTAWIMLVRLGNVRPGETVLVHSAGGGVGLAALQICRWKQARVVGLASASKHERLLALGVTHCIDYTAVDFERAVMDYTNGRGVDVVLDAVGGTSFKRSYRCLAPLGRLFLFGASSFSQGKRRNYLQILTGIVSLPWFHPLGLIDRNRAVAGVNMGHLWEELERLRADMEDIMGLTDAGQFAPVVDKVFSFDEAAAAHHYIQDRRNFGKVLLQP